MAHCASVLRCSYSTLHTAAGIATVNPTTMSCNAEAAVTSAPVAPSKVADLLNFRDVGHSAPDVCRSGKVFRTACPVCATPNQIGALSDMGISTVVDFRAAEEVEQFGEPDILRGATEYRYRRQRKGWFVYPTLEASTKVNPPQDPESEQHSPFEIHRLSLLERSRYVRAMLMRVPPSTVARSAVTRLWDLHGSRDLLIHEVNEGGLNMLYELIIVTSTLEIGVTMQVILKALQEGHAVMYYCKAGKDRTGIVTALLLSVLGATDEQIIDDYYLSDEHGQTALGNLAGKREVEKLDRAQFSRAPREAMEHLLTFVRDRYGSVSLYLEGCGFDSIEQAKLKSLLAPL
eukprot:jgi/Ulvmu1/1673/UM115_0002.1